MKIVINLLKFILITILTICIIALSFITIAFSTIFNKDYVIQKLEENNFYSEMYKLVESNFENYIYQSGLDEEVLDNICTEEKVKEDIDKMLSNIYDGTEQKIDTTEIANNLNENIEKSGLKNSQNENAIKQFIEHICDEYTNTLVHTKYENQINEVYEKLINYLNKIYRVALIALVIDIIAIIIINKKKISKDIQQIGIAMFATSFFVLGVWQTIISKVDINGIKIFNDVFSKSIVVIIKDVIYQIISLALGTIFISIILIAIYATIVSAKTPKDKEKNKTKEI